MDYGQRIKKLSFVFFLLGLVLVSFLSYRMHFQSGELSERLYMDRTMERLFLNLADENIIQPIDEGVSIDIARLREKITNPGTRQYILARQSYMHFTNNRLVVHPEAIVVQNRRIIRRAAALDRGCILDRKGRPLAISEKNNKSEFSRRYPLGPAIFPLLGVAHPIYGFKGLEASLSPYTEGREEVQSPLNRILRFLAARKHYYDVVLTIDASLQEKAFKALNGQSGAVVLVEVATGAVLAAVSSPSFDPETPPGEAWDAEASRGGRSAFINRAFDKRYPPGSTFKLVTATAWMEASSYDPKWGLECKGIHPRYNIREFRGKHHGWMGLKNAITLSCNIFFADIGPRLGMSLMEQAELFGFNRTFPLLKGTDKPLFSISSRAFTGHQSISKGSRWTPKDFRRNPKLVAQAAIGQNMIEATPLQMALVAAALANDGEMMAPMLVEKIQYVKQDKNKEPILKTFKRYKPQSAGRVCGRDTSKMIRSMMANVMVKGTGYRLKKLYLKDGRYHLGGRLPKEVKSLMAGKTGTAQAGKGKQDHAWFLGLVPWEKPKFAVAVVVEHGGLGSKIAGPIAVDMMHAALKD